MTNRRRSTRQQPGTKSASRPAYKPQVNRGFCSSAGLNRISLVRASGEVFRQDSCLRCIGGHEERLCPERCAPPDSTRKLLWSCVNLKASDVRTYVFKICWYAMLACWMRGRFAGSGRINITFYLKLEHMLAFNFDDFLAGKVAAVGCAV